MRRLKVSRDPVLLVAALCVLTGGCQEEFSDDAFGVLDLSSVIDGGVASNPAAGVPDLLSPQNGFIGGELGEYYDFGVIPFRSDPLSGVPRAVVVQPMYFFFRQDRYPLFSAPVRELRDGTDTMPGGRDVFNPNPKDHCDGVPMADRPANPCTARNEIEKKRSYPVRFREHLVDSVRNSDDYQRPIVDVVPGDVDEASPQYTGLWEIVEVTAPNDYRPDDVKSLGTLRRAIDGGKFGVRGTGKVINCPVMDERTYVPRGVTSRPVFRPRIELWYRRKLAYCYLADGWETLGSPEGQLYFANSDSERLDVFEVARLTLDGRATERTADAGAPAGEAKSTMTSGLFVPITRAWVPTIFSDDQGGGGNTTRIVESVITREPPRRGFSSPKGYSPARWMFDYQVPPDYEWGKIRSVEQIDPSAARPRQVGRSSPPRYIVRNISLRGVAVRCGHPTFKLTSQFTGLTEEKCGIRTVPDNGDPAFTIVKGDPSCDPLGLECNTDSCFCDAPAVGFGQACGPGVARCLGEEDLRVEGRTQCFPPWGGFCALGCNPRALNDRAGENEGKKPTEFIDTRCRALTGYQCLGGWCLKFCDQNVTDPLQCSAKTTENMKEVDLGAGQTCQDFGLEVCTWPEGYTPG